MRTEQARYLLDISIGDATSDFPDIASSIKILAGDFNSTRDEQPLKEIRYFFNEVTKEGIDTRSWPAVNPAIDIDHIFTFKGQKWNVKTRKSHIIRQSLRGLRRAITCRLLLNLNFQNSNLHTVFRSSNA